MLTRGWEKPVQVLILHFFNSNLSQKSNSLDTPQEMSPYFNKKINTTLKWIYKSLIQIKTHALALLMLFTSDSFVNSISCTLAGKSNGQRCDHKHSYFH